VTSFLAHPVVAGLPTERLNTRKTYQFTISCIRATKSRVAGNPIVLFLTSTTK